ncbi:MAG: trans-2-enoyl-CoA reductase family protein [Spirochaetaceae bacterium]|nr:MAG: trans-2-enoyl-CoA reductase family protein [Spirochaetaceae bacterium]
MVVHPMIRSNICMNAHPVGLARETQRQIDYVTSQGPLPGPRRVLIIGGSAGYGLASRIVAAYACNAATINVAFERPASGKRTATVGWYNTEYFEQQARADGKDVSTVYGDAFSNDVKDQVVDRIRSSWGSVDLVIYSLASPLRIDPETGEEYRSVLKPVGEPFTGRTVDTMTGEFKTVTMEGATPDEITATVKVMGGEDWQLWIDRLMSEGLLSDGAMTVAYSYIGPELTRRVYREGSIGRAKEHLERTARTLTERMQPVGGAAYVSVNKAVVTRASSVIPVVPLYGVILFRVMKEMGLHEGTIEQIYRLFRDRLYADGQVPVDEEGRIRIDDWEMRDDVQTRVAALFDRVDETTLRTETDIDEYHREFLRIHGFGVDGVDYDQDVDV